MTTRRILLLHISKITGHRSASRAIEKALRELDSNVCTYALDTLKYVNPFLARLVYLFYTFMIKVLPALWDYLYDNEQIFKKIRRIRSLIHRLNERKIKKILESFRPQIIVCTQAFPCVMLAEYKQRHNLTFPLVGVLTDYAPHSYWISDAVDVYIVPVAQVQQSLMSRGITSERLKVLGIPIESKFRKQTPAQQTLSRLGLVAEIPIILIMGGSQGLGPLKEIAQTLDTLQQPVQMIVVCGTNRRLYSWLHKNRPKFTKPLAIIGYTESIHDLMAISSFIVGKPGGLTSAEALSMSLPLIIINPLPGQEKRNSHFLLERGVALKVNSLGELKLQAEQLLRDRSRLAKLRAKALSLACPDSALRIARFILERARQQKDYFGVVPSL